MAFWTWRVLDHWHHGRFVNVALCALMFVICAIGLAIHINPRLPRNTFNFFIRKTTCRKRCGTHGGEILRREVLAANVFHHPVIPLVIEIVDVRWRCVSCDRVNRTVGPEIKPFNHRLP